MTEKHRPPEVPVSAKYVLWQVNKIYQNKHVITVTSSGNEHDK